jgi:mono/diheme cytochrome c family protein
MKFRIACCSAAVLFAVTAAPVWAQQGADLFKANHCAMCHGDQGQGKPPMAPKIAGTAKTEAAIVTLLTTGGGKKAPHTAAIKGLTADQAKTLAAYVKSLK